ncbi:MAG: hypothetical protein RRY21_05020, partial [Oscillospiraceae bacterium]
MMKRLTALLLAMLLTAGMTAGAVAATTDAIYPVGGVSPSGYLVDEDGNVDVGKPVSRVPYGSTVYFPLLNDRSSAGATAAKKTYEDAVIAFNTAASAYDAAENDYQSKLTAYNNAKAADDKAAADLKAGSSTTELKA